MEKLDASVSWSEPLRPVLAGHTTEFEPTELCGEPVQPAQTPVACRSEFLRFRVTRRRQNPVQLTYKALELESFAAELDDEVKEILRANHIDLEQIITEARDDHYAPGTLFNLEESAANAGVRLWLE